jgi:NADH-quinone oxidoreductase subunit L
MGGLRKAMPITFVTLLAASLAISGIPPFAGYFSKDAILLAAYHYAPWMYWVGTITAGLTAFYVFRAFFLAFVGKYRGHHHPHESPVVMTLPLIVLAVLSTGGGYLNITKWLSPMFPVAEGENGALVALSILAGVLGIVIAAVMYWFKPAIAASMNEGGLYRLIYNKYYVDEIYSALIVKPIELFSRFILWKGVDEFLVDGAVDGGSRQIRGIGAVLRRMQSGEIRNYAAWVMAGSLIVLIILGLAGGSR